MLLDTKSARRAHLDEDDTKMIERLLRQTAGEIPFDDNTSNDLQRLEDCGLTFQINGDVVKIVEDTIPDQTEETPSEIIPDNDDDEYWGMDVSLINPADFISSEQERHRRQLKIGPLSYKIAWIEGYTFDGKTPFPYKKGSKMRKIFYAGRRAAQE